MCLTPEEVIAKFGQRKGRALYWYAQAFLFLWIPYSMMNEFGLCSNMCVFVVPLGAVIAFVAALYFGSRCPSCQEPNLFMDREATTCRRCGVVLRPERRTPEQQAELAAEEVPTRFRQRKLLLWGSWAGGWMFLVYHALVLGEIITFSFGSFLGLVITAAIVAVLSACIVFYWASRCPRCRTPNLFMGPNTDACRRCGGVLRSAEQAKLRWMGGSGFIMLGVLMASLALLTLWLRENPIWLLLFIIPVFLIGPFLVHKYSKKLL